MANFYGDLSSLGIDVPEPSEAPPPSEDGEATPTPEAPRVTAAEANERIKSLRSRGGWSGALEDFAATALNSTALNTLPLLNSAVYGTANAIDHLSYFPTDEFDPMELLRGYGREYAESRDYFNKSRDDLTYLGGEEKSGMGHFVTGTADVAGTAPGLVTDALGKTVATGARMLGAGYRAVSGIRRAGDDLSDMLGRYAPAEAIDRLMLGGMTYGSSVSEVARRSVMSGVAAAGPGVAQDVIAGGVDPSNPADVASSALTNFAAGAGGQAIVGEGILRALRNTSSDGYINRFTSRMLDRIELPDGTGINRDTLRSAIEDLPDDGTLLDLRFNNEETADGIQALNRALADLSLPANRPDQVNEFERQDYARNFQLAQSRALQAVEDTTQGITDNLAISLRGSPSRREMLLFTNTNKAAIAPLYNEMTTTRARPDGTMPIGATPVDRLGFQTNVIDRFEELSGNPMGLGSQADQDMLALFRQSLMLDPQAARNLDDIRFAEMADDGAPRNIPLATLLVRGRATIANRMKPQLNDSYGPEHRVAASRLLRAIDAEIEATQLGDMPAEARRAWGAEMARLDAYDLGEAFFTSRMQGGGYDLEDHTSRNINAPQYGTNLDEYYKLLDSLPNGEQQREAFNHGFRHAAAGFVERHKVGAALNAFLGDVNLNRPGETFFAERPGEREVMKQILGEDNLNLLLQAADEERVLNARNAVVRYFDEAQVDAPPEAIDAATTVGLNGPMAYRLQMYGNGLATFSDKLYGDQGLAQSGEVLRLLNSPRDIALSRVDNSLNELSRPRPRGAASYAGMNEDDGYAEDQDEEARAVARQRLDAGPSFSGNIDDLIR